ncbi:fungal-specific transcription factor domain-containing protein [Suillus discolor]|uniref:Fungal-specific transcription factor domain-containing protein n=1 Tax=Suillus discolor TaxID=1912936 RepID=A0A9P7F9U3_9AGAM|nr:fungal-specific transcription factor domain-containing protein [Suillus discolor]KAG2110232.1 fungal-specific transcription factor domain-containing protein [Suillus discolor]
MSNPYYSSSASGSSSPPSETPSNNTSPANISAPLWPSRSSDEADSQSTHSRETPNRMPVDLPRASLTGRGGCWTCRLRRKKCDEQREGNSCHTCKRLRIDCLGWGTRRPEWMRDKKAVEDYKAGIKAQLTRAGLIRGQPKSSILQASSAGPSSTPASSSSVFPSRQFQPSASSSGSSRVNDLGMPAYVDSLSDPTGMSVFGSTLNSPQIISVPLYTRDGSFQRSNHNSPFSPSGSLPSDTSPVAELHFNPDFDTATQDLYNSPMTSIPDDGLQMEHIFYYFEHVRQLQYAFAGNSVANTTYSLVLKHPQGSVANAISALASLHFSLIRIAHGFEAPNPTLEHSPAIRFYDSAHQQLYRNKQTTLSESDANAAIHMLSFSLMSGGVTDWRPMLDIASEWLARTGITTSDNPKLMMINMNEASRLALKATMWCDIMSTLTLKTTPKHLSFYRRLFRGGSGYWGLTQQGIDESALRMDSLTGCPDEVLLGIAEIATLSCWKMQELRKGSLSMRELIRRGDVIERHLRTQTETMLSTEADQTSLHPDLSSMTVEHGNAQNSPTGHASTSLPADDTRRIVADIFREATILYLHTVLSEPNPGVPEIVNSIDVIVQLLNRLPVSNIDRCLVFPICLAGCLVDDPMKREFLKTRLQGQHNGFGNINQALRVMQTAWQKRDSQGGAVQWQDLLHIQGRQSVLLV